MEHITRSDMSTADNYPSSPFRSCRPIVTVFTPRSMTASVEKIETVSYVNHTDEPERRKISPRRYRKAMPLTKTLQIQLSGHYGISGSLLRW